MKESKYEMPTHKEESKSSEGLDDDKIDIPRKHVRIEDVSPEAFGWILDNLINPTLPKDPCVLANILYACDKYMMESLNIDYLTLIKKALFELEKITSLCQLFEALRKIGLQKIVESFIAYFPKQFGSKWMQAFSKLSLEVALLTVQCLGKVEEEPIWRACVNWAKGQVKKKGKDENGEAKEKEKEKTSESSSRKRKKPGGDDQALPA